VTVGTIDLEDLARDRDQLMAEAVAREAKGASITLPPELWPAAAAVQEAHTQEDPWVGILDQVIGDGEGRILVSQIVHFLGRWNHADTRDSHRLGAVMKKLGFERPNSAGTFKVSGRGVPGYKRGSSVKWISLPSPLLSMRPLPDELEVVEDTPF
jgi:hypothetical protein